MDVLFSTRTLPIDTRKETITVVNDKTGIETVFHPKSVIGCDGAFSAVRSGMMKSSRFNYRQDYLTHSYKVVFSHCLLFSWGFSFMNDSNARNCVFRLRVSCLLRLALAGTGMALP